jgi:hypothetical protein
MLSLRCRCSATSYAQLTYGPLVAVQKAELEETAGPQAKLQYNRKSGWHLKIPCAAWHGNASTQAAKRRRKQGNRGAGLVSVVLKYEP